MTKLVGRFALAQDGTVWHVMVWCGVVWLVLLFETISRPLPPVPFIRADFVLGQKAHQ